MSRLILKLLNNIYGTVVGSLLVTALLFSTYSIWDNSQIYRSATDVQDSIRLLRPTDSEDEGEILGFEELREINPDVVGWLIMEGVNIDYPVLQGDDNLEYMNKDVFGEFSLAGRIFLDSRCDPTFQSRYALIYGHNMDQHLMFGDLALYKDRDFFAEHTQGEIITPTERQEYAVVAILQLPAGTEEIFNTNLWNRGFHGMADFLREQSIWYHEDQVSIMERFPTGVQVAVLVTCSFGNTNDRTILVMMRERSDWVDAIAKDDGTGLDLPYGPDLPNGYDMPITPGQPGTPRDLGHGDGDSDGDGVSEGSGPKPTGDGQNPAFWYRVIGGIIVFIVIFESVDGYIRRRREEI